MTDVTDDWLRSILSEAPRETAVEAAYYVVRELKQSSVPSESRKEHLADAGASEPSVEARDLVSSIVRAIKNREISPLNELPPEALRKYVDVLIEAIRAITDESLRLNASRGRANLAKLRAL